MIITHAVGMELIGRNCGWLGGVVALFTTDKLILLKLYWNQKFILKKPVVPDED